jgi:hypothetical protein
MASDKQIKINENLHEEVKEFVDSDTSDYSSYKSFYEEATREHLNKAKHGKLGVDQEEAIREIVREELEEQP